MKVAMLGWELPPHNSGGLGVACHQLCRALADNGVDVDFLLPYSGNHDIDFMNIRHALPNDISEVIQLGTAYQSFRYINTEGKIHPDAVSMLEHQEVYAEAASQIIKNEPFDIIHAHDWLTFRAGMKSKLASGLPLVVHVHSVESDRSGQIGGGNPIVREIEAAGLLAADRIIAVSEHTKRTIIREYHIPADKISVIHNSIDREVLAKQAAHEGMFEYEYIRMLKEDGWKVVINVGRLTIQKGLDYLLRSAAKTVAKAPKTMFLFMGDGEQYQELLMKSAEYGISGNVLFAGFQRGKRWRDAFAVADLFVMPSVSEPFGLAPLEAIGYGVPVLVSKQSGITEVMKNMLKVDFWDVEKMAEYITAVVKSDSLGTTLRQNAEKEMEKLSWHAQVPQFTRLYKNTCQVGGLI